jgi:hypothetical protein
MKRLNGDGVVDAADYVVWRKNLSSSAAGSETSASVPEPGSPSLLALGSLTLFARRRSIHTLRERDSSNANKRRHPPSGGRDR